ncbi:MAG: TetR/AcrR family transcriptional regulator [Muribaculaceae bacterium]|jgi:AcrR family transcriptional regulator|nr:TetR/AcrR family transcriptional regulator [Muribaculaceae bacterium]
MVLKTRDKLIEVARQLFAQKGEENTTMNDIAVASEKGRRTVYTYFKNKKEILNAVVKAESDKIVEKLIDIPRQPLPPEQKLINFIFIRFEIIKELVYRNGSLRAGFFRDIRKVDRARRATISKEATILKQILSEGVEKGVFRVRHIDETASVMILALQGMDVAYVRNSFAELGIEKLKLREYIKDFILHGIKA